jgi:hypothetical protein
MPWWNVDHEIPKFAARHRFQVIADGIQMPAGDELGGGLDGRPGLANEGFQAASSLLPIDLVDQGGP